MVRTHLRIAWHAFKTNWRIFVLSMLLLFASWLILELSVVALQRLGVVVNVALHITFLVVFSVLMVGIQSIALQTVDGRIPPLKRMWELPARGPSYLLALLLYMVAVAGGLLLLVVPGIYLGVRYVLFGQVLASKQASALQALREAGSISQGQRGPLFGLLLAAAALNIVGAAMLGLGLAISFPVALLAISSFFRALQQRSAPTPSATPDRETLSASGR
jgi:uncharacterized membrane protein